MSHHYIGPAPRSSEFGVNYEWKPAGKKIQPEQWEPLDRMHHADDAKGKKFGTERSGR